MNLRFLIMALSVLLSSLAFAQNSAKAPKGIQIRPIAVALSGEMKDLKLRAGERDLGDISLETTVLGNPLGVAVRQFAFGVAQPDGSFRSLGTVKLPEAGSDFILVFSPTEESYQVFPIRVDDAEFRGDDYFLFNFTTFKIRVIAGETTKEVASMENGLLRPMFKKDDKAYVANFAYENDGKMMPFSNTRWLVNPNIKTLVFVYLEPETERPAYRAVSMLAAE